MDRITAASNAVPNPSMTNESPITACVIINVTALMTNKNRPKVKIVSGNVKIIRIGLTIIFSTDKMRAANKAVPKPSNRNESNNSATITKATAFKTKDNIQRININHPFYPTILFDVSTFFSFFIQIGYLKESQRILYLSFWNEEYFPAVQNYSFYDWDTPVTLFYTQPGYPSS